MLTWILIIMAFCCAIGILTGKIALGVVFTMALFVVFYWIIIIIQKQKLSEIGIVIVLVGIVSLIYTSCILFFGVDLKSILGF